MTFLVTRDAAVAASLTLIADFAAARVARFSVSRGRTGHCCWTHNKRRCGYDQRGDFHLLHFPLGIEQLQEVPVRHGSQPDPRSGF